MRLYETVEDGFRYGRLVLATTTYNTGVFPFMRHFIDHLVARGYRNRRVGLIENGTWAPAAAKGMRTMLSGLEGIDFCPTVVTVKGAMTEETAAAIDALAGEMLA